MASPSSVPHSGATALRSFLEKLRQSLETGGFVKMTLSEYHGETPGLRNVYARLVELKEGVRLSLTWHYASRDVVKNVSLPEGAEMAAGLLGREFGRAHLFSLTADWQLKCDASGAGVLKASRPAFAQQPPLEHDRTKTRVIEAASAPFLPALGVTNSAGEPRPGMADKLRQIQRFVELISHLVDGMNLGAGRDCIRALDIGSGKGYLTFALAEYFRQRGRAAEIVGVERREDLVALTNRVAREQGYDRLRFVQAEAGELESGPPIDLLIALHACDTATDDAIYQGITAAASLIVVAPCCHQEVRPQMFSPAVLRPLLRHGILLERAAETLTDAIRAQLLEICEYKASVFEFISTEHTGKNLMIAAQKRTAPSGSVDEARRELRELLAFYGVREQRLARLLGELPEAGEPQ